MGGLGYFPTYTLGNINAAQLFAAARQDPAIAAAIDQADYAPLLAWLRQSVHAHGATLDPADLMLQATGSRPSTRRLPRPPPIPLSLTPMPRGLLIVIEGIDGTGKSTHARRLGEWFVAQGREVVLSREPTDGPWGSKLRESAATGRLVAGGRTRVFPQRPPPARGGNDRPRAGRRQSGRSSTAIISPPWPIREPAASIPRKSAASTRSSPPSRICC